MSRFTIARNNQISEAHSTPDIDLPFSNINENSKLQQLPKNYSAHTIGSATTMWSKTKTRINPKKANQLDTTNLKISLLTESQDKFNIPPESHTINSIKNHSINDNDKSQFSNSAIQQNSIGGPFSVLTDNTRPVLSKRPSIAIRRTPSGNENLTFLELDSESQIQLPTKKFKKLKKLRRGIWNCCFAPDEVELEETIPALRQISRDRLAKAIFKQKFTLRKTSFHDLLLNEISEENQKCLFLTAAYTVNNYFGKPGPQSASSQQLSSFLNEIVSLSTKDKSEFINKAKNIKAPSFVLNLKILEATNLIATDPDGLSDPFCKIWLNNKKQEAKLTEIKEHTVDPMWNETFLFPLTDVTKDVLHIELWDRDPVGIVANLNLIWKVKSVHGCFLFCTDFFDNICNCRGTIDDFIGKTKINIGSIYSEGIDQWLSLKTIKDEDQQGELHIEAKIEVIKPKDTTDALKRHFLLVKLCIKHGLQYYETPNVKIASWEQIFRSEANTLLFQHGVQGNISILEDVICRFVNLIHSIDTNVLFDNQFLYVALKEASDNIQNQKTELADYYFSSHLLENLFKNAVEQLKNKCFSYMANFHSFRLTDDPAQCSDIEYILKSASLCEEIAGMATASELWSVLKLECQTWLEKQLEEIQNIKDETSKTISDFLKELRNYHMAADDVIKKVFLNQTYTQHTFDIIDEILSGSLKSHVVNIALKSRNSGKNTKLKEEALEVFREFKNLTNYLSGFSISTDETKLDKFHEWFNLSTILNWFLWKQEIASEKIYKIVTMDDLENKLIECGDRYEKQSDSPKKASEVIEKELVELWTLVHHSQYPECDKFFLKSLNFCSMKYASGLLELIYSRKLLDTDQEGKKGICVIANNLWSFAIYISKITSETGNMKRGFPNTKISLQSLCKLICADLSKECAAELQDIINKVAIAKTKRKQYVSLSEYKNFINKTFRLMAITEMSFEIYLIFSHEMWKLLLREVCQHKDVHIKIRATCMWRIRNAFGKAVNLVEGLINVLNETEKVLYFDKAGKLKEIFYDNEYNNLKTYLEKKLYYE